MPKSDVAKKPSLEENNQKVKYFCGKRFITLSDGKLLTPAGRAKGSGRLGFPTVAVRVPVPLLPFIQEILKKCEEIETTRRIVMNNIYNTSPDFNLVRGIQQSTEEYLNSSESAE